MHLALKNHNSRQREEEETKLIKIEEEKTQ